VKLLLDTHIWLWSLVEPKRLNARVLKELQNPENELWLSPISIWELLVLCEKGRVAFNEEAETWIGKALSAAPLFEALITHEVALRSRRIDLPHKDPADRFLIATAKVFGLTLVTADERLLGTRDIAVLANRQ